MEKETNYRPTIEDKLYFFRQMKEDPETGDFQANLDELHEFAAGRGDKQNQEEWYNGWKKEDFEKLLRQLEEEGIIE